MNTYKITYANGNVIFDKALSSLAIVKKYDLASRDNATTVITQL